MVLTDANLPNLVKFSFFDVEVLLMQIFGASGPGCRIVVTGFLFLLVCTDYGRHTNVCFVFLGLGEENTE